jgi:hypothetical protein
VMFHAKPHIYSGLERDHEFRSEYIRVEDEACP